MNECITGLHIRYPIEGKHWILYGKWRTSDLIIEVSKHGGHIIADFSTTPLHAKEQDTYRDKPSDIFDVISIVEDLYYKHYISEGAIITAFDGLGAIKIHGQ